MPEPATFILIGGGFAGLFAWKRCRKWALKKALRKPKPPPGRTGGPANPQSS